MDLSGKIRKAQMKFSEPGEVSPNTSSPESPMSEIYKCHACAQLIGSCSPGSTSGTLRSVKRRRNPLALSVCLPSKTTFVDWQSTSTLCKANWPLFVITDLACSALNEPTFSREEGIRIGLKT